MYEKLKKIDEQAKKAKLEIATELLNSLAWEVEKDCFEWLRDYFYIEKKRKEKRVEVLNLRG